MNVGNDRYDSYDKSALTQLFYCDNVHANIYRGSIFPDTSRASNNTITVVGSSKLLIIKSTFPKSGKSIAVRHAGREPILPAKLALLDLGFFQLRYITLVNRYSRFGDRFSCLKRFMRIEGVYTLINIIVNCVNIGRLLVLFHICHQNMHEQLHRWN